MTTTTRRHCRHSESFSEGFLAGAAAVGAITVALLAVAEGPTATTRPTIGRTVRTEPLVLDQDRLDLWELQRGLDRACLPWTLAGGAR